MIKSQEEFPIFSNVLMGDLIPKGKHQCEWKQTALKRRATTSPI